jgi:hypothetical protein
MKELGHECFLYTSVEYNNKKHQWTKSIKRDGRIYKNPRIDLHDILSKNIGGDKTLKGVTLNFKGGEKQQKKERKIRSMKTEGMSLLKEGILSEGITLCH